MCWVKRACEHHHSHHDAAAELATPEREHGLQFERCGDVQVRAEACTHKSPIRPFAFDVPYGVLGIGREGIPH